MPNDYVAESSVADIMVLSPTQVIAVTRFGIRTIPSDVLVYVNVPAEQVSAQQARVTLEQWALSMESVMRLPNVIGARPEQDTDPSGLLADYMVVTIEVDDATGVSPGPFTDEVRFLSRYLSSTFGFKKYIADPIAKAVAGLDAAVNG
jgi:hypothetical protein